MLSKLREPWGTVFPRVMAYWETKAYAVLVFLRYPQPIRRCLSTKNQMERLIKKLKLGPWRRVLWRSARKCCTSRSVT